MKQSKEGVQRRVWRKKREWGSDITIMSKIKRNNKTIFLKSVYQN